MSLVFGRRYWTRSQTDNVALVAGSDTYCYSSECLSDAAGDQPVAGAVVGRRGKGAGPTSRMGPTEVSSALPNN